jgi:hypothetical protein
MYFAALNRAMRVVRTPGDRATEWHGREQSHPMLPSQQLEVASQRREAAGLDLDQHVAADEIDHETVDDPLDAIAGASVPVLELRACSAPSLSVPIAGNSRSCDAGTSSTECTTA